jgi:hypothetical protein
MEWKLIGFTGFEKEFTYEIKKKDAPIEDYICKANYHVQYDSFYDTFEIRLDDVYITKWSAKDEEYQPYALSKEEFNQLQSEMTAYADWNEYYDQFIRD